MKDRLSPERTGKQLVRITVLVTEVAPLWMDALETGVYSPRRENGGRGTGFEDHDPTSSAAFSPTQKQIRGKVKRASVLIEQAMEKLEQAEAQLKDGFLEQDPEFLAYRREKRQAATQE